MTQKTSAIYCIIICVVLDLNLLIFQLRDITTIPSFSSPHFPHSFPPCPISTPSPPSYYVLPVLPIHDYIYPIGQTILDDDFKSVTFYKFPIFIRFLIGYLLFMPLNYIVILIANLFKITHLVYSIVFLSSINYNLIKYSIIIGVMLFLLISLNFKLKTVVVYKYNHRRGFSFRSLFKYRLIFLVCKQQPPIYLQTHRWRVVDLSML